MKTFKDYMDSITDELYRATTAYWLKQFLTNHVVNTKFTSMSRTQADEFGDILIVFDEDLVQRYSKCVEVEYDREFFEKHLDISRYVLAYTPEEYDEEYADHEHDMDFEQYVNGYEDEEEVLILDKLTYIGGIIKRVILSEPDDEIERLLKSKNIPYTIKDN